MLKEALVAGCSKTLRYKATEIPVCLRQAEEWDVHPSTSQQRGMFTRLRREGNAADGRFSATC